MGPARRLRAALTATEGRRLAVSFAGYALGGIGLILLLTSSAVAAAACLVAAVVVLWLAGAWVSPWGDNAYHRKVERILAEWVAEIETVADDSPEAIAAFGEDALNRLGEVRVPSARAPEHERLTGRLSAYLDALDGDDEDEVRARHSELDDELEALERRASAAWRGGDPAHAPAGPSVN